MEPSSNTQSHWRILRRLLISTAVLATLVALFYTEEDWRGKHAWENYKHAAEAKGVVLDWNALIPPPVPDDQNFFAAPKMQEWFVRDNTGMTNQSHVFIDYPNAHVFITNIPKSVKFTAVMTNVADASRFLAWSDQFQPDFDLIRDALKRPDTRTEGNYSIPYQIPIANFINVRTWVQILAQRAECYILLGQPDKALEQLTLLNDSRRIMERLPTGHPMTLVDAMINVAVTSLYAETIAYGFQHHAWQEPQLAALQAQLAAVNLPALVSSAFDDEQAAECATIETISFSRMMNLSQSFAPASPKSFLQKLEHFWLNLYGLMPRGWVYQNLVETVEMVQKGQDGIDLQNNQISPQKTDSAMREIQASFHHHSPFNLYARIAVPNFSRAIQRLAYVQTEVNEGQIACALERYHQAYGIYPGSLDALVPHYLEAIPHDIIDGGPLIYRPTLDGKFLLYSIGWSEKDNGGKGGLTNYPPQGDWVWKN